MSDAHSKIIVVGWDGATFDIIDPMLERGLLPNLSHLLETGCRTPLQSTIPPLTPTAWTSITTGTDPGKHGIFDGIIFSPGERKLEFVNASLRHAPPIWSLLNDAGKTSGVVNVPATYPVDNIRGYMIAGMFTPPHAPQAVHPECLERKLKRSVRNFIGECKVSSSPRRYLSRILKMIGDREQTCLYLMRRYPTAFRFFTFIAADRVQHFFWKFRDPSHPLHKKFGAAVEIVYQRLDQALGRILNAADGEATIIMVSDHGAGPLHTSFYLNKWLADRGYLVMKPMPGCGKRANAPRSLLQRAFIKLLPRKIATLLHLMPEQPELSAFLNRIDWTQTRAFSEGVAGGIYINGEIGSVEDYNETVRNLRQDLLTIRGPDGRQVIRQTWNRNELYTGEQTRNAADIILVCAPGYSVIAPNEMIYFDQSTVNHTFFPHRWSARHEQNGILVMSGKSIKPGAMLKPCSVTDVAPTILYLMGQPVPEHMDGRVVEEGIEDTFLARTPVRYAKSSLPESKTGAAKSLSVEEENTIIERLRNLGYME